MDSGNYMVLKSGRKAEEDIGVKHDKVFEDKRESRSQGM